MITTSDKKSRQATRSITPLVRMACKRRFPACPYQIGSLLNQLSTAYVTDGFTWWIFVSYSNKTCNILPIGYGMRSWLIDSDVLLRVTMIRYLLYQMGTAYLIVRFLFRYAGLWVTNHSYKFRSMYTFICIKIASTFLRISWIGKLFQTKPANIAAWWWPLFR